MTAHVIVADRCTRCDARRGYPAWYLSCGASAATDEPVAPPTLGPEQRPFTRSGERVGNLEVLWLDGPRVGCRCACGQSGRVWRTDLDRYRVEPGVRGPRWCRCVSVVAARRARGRAGYGMPASDLVVHRVYRIVSAVAGTPHNSRGRFYVECPGGHRGYVAIGTAPRGRPSWCRCVERTEGVADAAE